MIELIKKELRGLAPAAVLIVALAAAVWLHFFLTEFPDLPTPDFDDSSDDSSDDSEVWLVFFGFFASIVGANLLVGEHASGTLRFLDALPISRTRIFFAKVFAALSVLASPILPSLLNSFLELFAMGEQTHPQIVPLLVVARKLVVVFYFLSVTAFLSFAGKWFAMAVGFLLWGFFWMHANQVAWIGWLDPRQLLAAQSFPWKHCVAMLGTGTVLFGFAWLGFCALGDRAEHFINRAGRQRFAPMLRLLCLIITPLVWIGAVAHPYLGKRAKQTAPEQRRRGAHEEGFGSEQTRRYDFVFREDQRSEAQKLIASADRIHDTVTAFLGADPVPGRIVVDLGSQVVQHAAGQANWTKIRIPLDQKRDLSFLKAALGHETTHVYINKLSGGAMLRHFASSQFFHEGLATLVEHKFFSPSEKRLHMRRVAAFAHSRTRIPLSALVNSRALGEKRDEKLVYPLGEVFCESLVSLYGQQAPGMLLRAFTRPGAPVGLEGMELWRKTMQSCGFDLERVVAGYDTALERAAREEAEFIAQFPKISAGVEIVGGEIVIRPNIPAVGVGRLVVQVEIANGTHSIYPVGEDGSVRIPRGRHTHPTLRYLVGWSTDKARFPLFENWAETDLNALSASPR